MIKDSDGNEYSIYELSSVDITELMDLCYSKNDSEAMCALGYCYENGINGLAVNKEEAFKLYCMAADKGEANGIYNKGVCLGFGIGSGKEKDARGWLTNIKKAAEMGFAPAQNDYGWAFEMAKDKGFFDVKDLKEAFKWYLKSAMQDHHTGIENVIRCYKEGIGTQKDLKKALEWECRLYGSKEQAD